MDVYKLSRSWFDFAFENTDMIAPIHSAIYFFAIEQCNRLGWKEKFGFPTSVAMEAIGVRNYKTYIKALEDLVNFGFIRLIEKSKNQYCANVIALVKNTNALPKALPKAQPKALDKALFKHNQKQVQSTDSIDIQDNNNTNLQNTSLQEGFFLLQEFSKIFYSENPNYEPSQEKDYPALRLFAEHVSKKLFQTSNFAEKSKPEQLLILEELKKVSKWYKDTNCIKSLETLAKFQIQEVFIKIKQGFQTFKKAEEYVPNFPAD